MAKTKKRSATAAKAPSVKEPGRAKGSKEPSVEKSVPEAPQESSHSVRLRGVLRRIGHFGLHSSLAEVLLIAALVISHYLPNSDFSYPSEVILPSVLFGVLSTIFFYAYKFIFRSSLVAHAAALPLAYGLYGFTYAYPTLHRFADRLTPDSLATPFTSAAVTVLVWAVVFGILAFALDKVVCHFKVLRDMPLLRIAVFAVCFIFVVQLGKVGQRMWTIRDQLNYAHNTAQDIPKAPASGTNKRAQPNVYYLVFDRYASQETLAKNYNYDNTKMAAFLDSQGFVTRTDAYANYPFTPQSVASTMRMDYLGDLGQRFENNAVGFQTAFPYRSILDNPPIAQILSSHGYKYNQVSSWWDFTRNNPAADSEPTKSFRLRILGKQFWLTDLQRDVVNKSVLSPLLLKGLTIGNDAVVKYDRDRNPRENFDVQLAALQDIAATSQTSRQPQFTFAHILSPHDPYVFTEDGGEPAYSVDRNDDGLDEKVKYAKQLTYVNTRFEQLIRTLRQKDPSAAIIIQADEGPYPKEFRGALTPTHYYDPVNLPLSQMRQKFGILASYYIPGVPPETVKQEINSSVNVFRFLLNQYFGYSLKQLPDCQFTAGNKYYMYRYELVSGKLRDLPEPKECRHYQ